MASKRHIRRKQCESKRRFPDHDSANSAMRLLIFSGKKNGGYLHVYKCCFCRGYHFGHAPGSSS